MTRAFVLFTLMVLVSCASDQHRPEQAMPEQIGLAWPNSIYLTCDTIDTVALPTQVSERINAFISAKDDREYWSLLCTYKLTYNDRFDIYVAKLSLVSLESYRVMLFNKTTKHASEQMVYIDGRWDGNEERGYLESIRLMSEQVVTLKDVLPLPEKEVILNERVHNGNVVNAVVQHYYTLDENSDSLKHLFDVESLYFAPMEELYVHRRYANGQVKVYVNNNKTQVTDDDLIGSYWLLPENAYQATGIEADHDEFVHLLLPSTK